MEVDIVDSCYTCLVDIDLSGGDIQFDVSTSTQFFSFKSGLAFMSIPIFLSTLSSLYKGEMSEAQLDCHGNFDCYIFSTDGKTLFIKHIGHYPEGIFNYQFELRKYMEAIALGFQEYLKQVEQKGVLPLKNKNLVIR